MVTVEEAQKLVNKCAKALNNTEQVLFHESLGFVLAEDVYSLINMPPFPQSAMDGYAINLLNNIDSYKLVGEVAAGDTNGNINLKPGEAIRIFTGAPVPESANVVVKQEICVKVENTVKIEGHIKLKDNIRPIGEQIKKGDLALKKGTKISPSGVGLLAALGITKVKVYKKPSICIIATGNELVKPGGKLLYGKIYESNSFMLQAAFLTYGYSNNHVKSIKDSFEETLLAIKEGLQQSDVLVLTGGISVGDYDFVGKALNEIGVKQIFYKVKQKPGKPLYFGTCSNKLIFALPGNPAASLTSFYTYVLPALDLMSGKENYGLAKKFIPIADNYSKKGDRAQFLKAYVKNNKVRVLEGQSSAMLHTYALSNAIVYLSSGVNEVKKGEQVETYLL